MTHQGKTSKAGKARRAAQKKTAPKKRPNKAPAPKNRPKKKAAQKKTAPKKKGGRPITLTMKQARQIELLYTLVGTQVPITDEHVARVAGITPGQFKGWINRNTKPVDEKGRKGPEGLRTIRERARMNCLAHYLQEHYDAIQVALDVGRPGDAIRGLEWIMEKFAPKLGKVTEDRDEGETGVLLVPAEQDLDMFIASSTKIEESAHDRSGGKG